MNKRVFICGGDETPGPRGTDCPNVLHDHPLPSSYVDAGIVAGRRLNKRWTNKRCPDCGLYGWVPPAFQPVPAAGAADTERETA